MRTVRNYVLLILVGLFWCAGSLRAQDPGTYTFFGGALLGSPSGFAVGAGLGFDLTHNVTFEPTVALGRTGNDNMFSLDGSFLYNFHLSDTGIVPYVLGGVGLAQFGNETHGSPILGFGARFPLHNGWQLRPEVRFADHGLARFTFGLSHSF